MMVEQHPSFLSRLEKGTMEVMFLAKEPQYNDPIKAST